MRHAIKLVKSLLLVMLIGTVCISIDVQVFAEKVNGEKNMVDNKTNIENGGFICIKKDWYYFYDDYRSGLFKMKKDGSKSEKLFNHRVDYIYIKGDWVYFSSNFRLYKIQTNGRSLSTVLKDILSVEEITNQWIYYVDKRNNNVYRTDFDGKNKTFILDHNISLFQIMNDCVYYINPEDKKLYKKYGEKIEKVRDFSDCSDIEFFITPEGFTYYLSSTDNNRLYKSNLKGDWKTLISKEIIYTFLYDKGRIIYNGLKDGYEGIYLINTDSDNKSCKTIVRDNDIRGISLVGDRLFYIRSVYISSKNYKNEVHEVGLDNNKIINITKLNKSA